MMNMFREVKLAVTIAVTASLSIPLRAQLSMSIWQYRGQDATLCFFDKEQSQYVPHLIGTYREARELHRHVWDTLPSQAPFMMLSDWQDDGNAGVTALPHNTIQISMAPLNMSYWIAPSNERYAHLFRHEYTHVVMSDKPSASDQAWRRFLGGKIVTDSDHPASAVWSWLTVPRWYAPRWFHEGIATFMETWMSGGAGRSLGGYDEMYFRTLVSESSRIHSVVGLETEGTTEDFQVGTNSYLYGTRFVSYLVMRYGFESLRRFYNRSSDSRRLLASQFREVYGKSLDEAWDEWREWETAHQRRNLEILAQAPLTDDAEPLTDMRFGSMSPMLFDSDGRTAYAAVNHPGATAHIERFDLVSGSHSRVASVDGPMLYQTAYMAIDTKGRRLFWTDRNQNLRGLVEYDLERGRILRRMPFQRVSDIAYDTVRSCLYGLMTNRGVSMLVRYDSSLENRELLYTFPFGVSVSDLAVSHDGSRIAVAMLGTDASHSLIEFSVDDLENARIGYRTVCVTEDSNLTQFRYSYDDSRLVGCSYYTGVSNLWEVDAASGHMEMLTNVTTGMFAPYQTDAATLYALRFTRDGMEPVRLGYRRVTDAEAVTLLGQLSYEADPSLASLGDFPEGERPETDFGQVYDSITVYSPLREMRFQGAYPEITGFVDRDAWNGVTPVAQYRVTFSDPLGLSSLSVSLGASPWSGNDWKNRFHAAADWRYGFWKLSASWNKTGFYDLFGPFHTSRTGYGVSLSYDRSNTLQTPLKVSWGGSVGAYGMMDHLPLYQNVDLDEGITSLQTLSFHYRRDFSRSSLGSVMAEKGRIWSVSGYSYLAGGSLFPSLSATYDIGTLLPFGRNNSIWLRTAVGQNFGDPDSSLGNDYFGGFRNNIVDNGDVYRYRSVSSMPGTEIDRISAHSYLKATGEVNLRPLRFNGMGEVGIYPTYAQLSCFASALRADPWGSAAGSTHVSLGAQLNVETVLFTHMKTVWSVGYARIFSYDSPLMPSRDGEWLFTIKLL